MGTRLYHLHHWTESLPGTHDSITSRSSLEAQKAFEMLRWENLGVSHKYYRLTESPLDGLCFRVVLKAAFFNLGIR